MAPWLRLILWSSLVRKVRKVLAGWSAGCPRRLDGMAPPGPAPTDHYCLWIAAALQMEGREGGEGKELLSWVEKSNGLWRNMESGIRISVFVCACGEGRVKFHFQGHSGPPTVVIRRKWWLFSVFNICSNNISARRLIAARSLNKVWLFGGNKTKTAETSEWRQPHGVEMKMIKRMCPLPRYISESLITM